MQLYEESQIEDDNMYFRFAPSFVVAAQLAKLHEDRLRKILPRPRRV